jgi:hypothetical protein
MTPEHPIRRGQRYNRIIMAVFGVGILAFFAGMLADQYLAGLVVYAIACLSGIGALLYFQFVSSVELGDERDRRLHNRTSGTVITVAAFVGLPIVIGLYLADATQYYTISPTVWGAIFAFAGLYLLWGAVYTVYRYQQ